MATTASCNHGNHLEKLYDHKDMVSEIILDEFWMGEVSIFSLIPPKRVLPDHPHHGVKADFIWIDVFCLNQLDGNRVTTIRRVDEIYYNAHEYHLIELGSVFRGWILFELASAREGVLPIVHTSNKDMSSKKTVSKAASSPSLPIRK